MNLHHGDERCVEVIAFGLFRVQDLDGVRSTGNREDRAAEEVLGELFCIESGGGDDQLQVRSTLK